METTKGWKASRERMESGSGVRCGIAKGGSCGVRTQGTTIIREREEQMVRWCSGMAPPCQASNRNGTATPGVPHGDNCEVQCSPDVRKKPRFTHVRDNLHGDVSGKRFSMHVVEGIVAGVA